MQFSIERINTLRAHALMARIAAEISLLQNPPRWARSRLGFTLKVLGPSTLDESTRDLYDQFQEMVAKRIAVLSSRYDKLTARYPTEVYPFHRTYLETVQQLARDLE